MIEVIYKDEKQEATGMEGEFSVPRNIRQIGLVHDHYRIYVEDYVYTFLGRLAEAGKKTGEGAGRLAVLVGDTKWSEGITYVFIRGAIAAENAEAAAEHIDFSEKMWNEIHEEQEKYFSRQEIVGWFFSQPGLTLEATEFFQRVHLKHFGGSEKVLMLMDPLEREDAFFRYDNGFLVRQEGYYIFYERNPQMQAYMMEKNPVLQTGTAEEVKDDAVQSFRKMIKEKKKQRTEETESGTSVFSYAATACLVIAVLAVGASFYRNYRELQRSGSVFERELEKETDETTEYPASSETIWQETEVKVTPVKTQNQQSEEDKEKSEGSASDGTDSDNADSDKKNTQMTNLQGKSETTAADVETEGESTGEGKGDSLLTEQRQEADLRKTNRSQNDVSDAQDVQNDAGQEATGGTSEQESGQGREQESEQTSGTTFHESYVIRPGDTLYQISMTKYGTMEAISEICRLNGISEEEIIYPGQIIVLP